jgi:ribosomal protein L16 Arg81 hydroxylase
MDTQKFLDDRSTGSHDSMATGTNMALRKLLGEMPVKVFTEDYFQERGCHFTNEEARFDGLCSWDDLTALLNLERLPSDDVKLVKKGKRVSYNDWRSLLDEVRQGATLVFNNIHRKHQGVSQFSRRISRSLQAPTQVNLYLSQPAVGGFDLHYDTHDVFIIQIAGSKKWRVFPPTVLDPLFYQKKHGKSPPAEPYLDLTLQKDSVLYIPRGHWHDAVAGEEQSMHLTLGLLTKTGVDFLSWIVDELRESPKVRKSLPLRSTESQRTNGAWLDAIRSEILDLLSDTGVVERFRQSYMALSEVPFPFSLPSQVVGECVRGDRLFVVCPYPPVLLDEKPDKVRLRFAGKILHFHPDAKGILQAVVGREEFTYYWLRGEAAGFSVEEIDTVLSVLIREGVVSETSGVATR